MVLSIPISPQVELHLKAKAAAAGVDLATYAARHLELLASPTRSLQEMSGPIAKWVAKRGMSDEELAEFLEREKHLMRAERRTRKAK